MAELIAMNENKINCQYVKVVKVIGKPSADDFFNDFSYTILLTKQLPRKMMARLVIIECAGYTSRQLFLWQI